MPNDNLQNTDNQHQPQLQPHPPFLSRRTSLRQKPDTSNNPQQGGLKDPVDHLNMTTATSPPAANSPAHSPSTRQKNITFALTDLPSYTPDSITAPLSSSFASATPMSTSTSATTTATASTPGKRVSGRSRRITIDNLSEQLASDGMPNASPIASDMTSAPHGPLQPPSASTLTPTANGARRVRTRNNSSASSTATTMPLGPNKTNVNHFANKASNKPSDLLSSLPSTSSPKKSHKYVPKPSESFDSDEFIYWPDGNGDITANNILDPDSTERSTRNKLKQKIEPAPLMNGNTSRSTTQLLISKLPSAAKTSLPPTPARPKKLHKTAIPTPSGSTTAKKHATYTASHRSSPSPSMTSNKRRKTDSDLPATSSDHRKKPRLAPPQSTLASAPPQLPIIPQTPLEQLRTEFVAEREANLQAVVGDHDSKVRELFHMEVYMTMLAYDPEKARTDKSERLTKVSFGGMVVGVIFRKYSCGD